MGIIERFRRWRASKGYGVHSPTAFRLVRRVVRPQRDVVYYGEERLRESVPGGGIHPAELRRARLLLRFVAEMQPAYVWTAPRMPEIYVEAIRLAGCVVRIYDGEIFPTELPNADMAVLDRATLKKKELERFFRPGKSLIGFGLGPEFMKRVAGAVGGGVVLEAVESVMAVSTRDTDTHIYRIGRI